MRSVYLMVRVGILMGALVTSSCGTVVARNIPMKGKQLEAVIDEIEMDYTQFHGDKYIFTPKDSTDGVVVVRISFQNSSTTMQVLDPSLFLIHGPDSKRGPAGIFSKNILGETKLLNSKDKLNPGDSITRIMIFAFPKKVRPVMISHPDFGEIVIPKNAEGSSRSAAEE